MAVNYQHLGKDELIALLIKKDRQLEQLKKKHDENSRDELTNAYNRNTGFELMSRKMKKSDHIVLCLIDMNGLKQINDIHGHVEGDKAIQSLVMGIESCIRKQDFIIRIGGDEFVIVFNNADMNTARTIVKNIKQKLSKVENEKGYKISFSSGLVDCSKYPDKTIKEIIDIVDKKMYKEKEKVKAKMGLKLGER